jgi:hypothetical protein
LRQCWKNKSAGTAALTAPHDVYHEPQHRERAIDAYGDAIVARDVLRRARESRTS